MTSFTGRVVKAAGGEHHGRAALCLDSGYTAPVAGALSRQMQRKYRKGKQLGLWVSDETAEQLAALSERTKLPQSQLLRRALELLFTEFGVEGQETKGMSPKRGRSP